MMMKADSLLWEGAVETIEHSDVSVSCNGAGAMGSSMVVGIRLIQP